MSSKRPVTFSEMNQFVNDMTDLNILWKNAAISLTQNLGKSNTRLMAMFYWE